MKKILVLMVAVFVMTMTASAQKKITEEQALLCLENLQVFLDFVSFNFNN